MEVEPFRIPDDIGRPQKTEDRGNDIKNAGPVFRRLRCGGEEDIDQRKKEEQMEPPLGPRLKGAIPGRVKVEKRGDDRVNEDKNFKRAL